MKTRFLIDLQLLNKMSKEASAAVHGTNLYHRPNDQIPFQ